MLGASQRRRFTLDAGSALLEVNLQGQGYPGLDALVDDRLAAFVTHDGEPAALADAASRRRVRCTFEFADAEWLPGDDARPPIEPVAVRSGDAWDVHWPYYRGRFGPDEARATLARRAPSLEHALRGAAVFATMPPDLFFHAAALVYDGVAWLVPGHPGAGKSTIAREGGADRVISNEISTLTERAPGTWTVVPGPFWGTGDVARRTEPAPLGGIAVLEQATDRNRWLRLEGARAVAALLPHVACQAAAQLADGEILRRVAALAGAVPTWSLAWYRPSHPLEGLAWSR